MKRVLTAVAGVAVVAGLLVPSAAAGARPVLASPARRPAVEQLPQAVSPDQVPPGEPGGYATVDTVKRYILGKQIGPSSYTYGGEFTIIGWTADGQYWQRQRSAATCPSCETVGVDGVTPDGLPHWADPISWDWGHILGETWSAIWNDCLSGTTKGIVGTAGSTLLVNLVARGGAVFVGPWGYAAIAIGGCIAQALD